MRVLQIVKTTDGAQWAIDQVSELIRSGNEVHVVLPRAEGRLMEGWHRSGARLHFMKIDLPLKAPWRFNVMMSDIRRLVSDISPDVIHSHFFSTTLAIRYALGKRHPTPRVFQVPGPFHMEYAFFRRWELSSVGISDFWIASSGYTFDLYAKAGVPAEKLFLSYYGNREHLLPSGSSELRKQLGIGCDQIVIGNINYMYPPRLYLGQRVGIKRHEDVIDALSQVIQDRTDVVGLIIGGQWGGGDEYEQKLRRRAKAKGKGRIFMTGRLPVAQAKDAWLNFDLAIHVPVSENCGGVVEPLMAGVPVIASRTGGLPEVILDGVTGKLVEPANPAALAEAIEAILPSIGQFKRTARLGRHLVEHMFDVKRTAEEVAEIYRYLLGQTTAPPHWFEAKAYLDSLPQDWSIHATD